jgi:hypothetical protein
MTRMEVRIQADWAVKVGKGLAPIPSMKSNKEREDEDIGKDKAECLDGG